MPGAGEPGGEGDDEVWFDVRKPNVLSVVSCSDKLEGVGVYGLHYFKSLGRAVFPGPEGKLRNIVIHIL